MVAVDGEGFVDIPEVVAEGENDGSVLPLIPRSLATGLFLPQVLTCGHQRLSQAVLSPVLSLVHGMLCTVSDAPNAVSRCCFTQQAAMRREQFSCEVWFLAELSNVAYLYDCALDGIPNLVGEAFFVVVFLA